MSFPPSFSAEVKAPQHREKKDGEVSSSSSSSSGVGVSECAALILALSEWHAAKEFLNRQ